MAYINRTLPPMIGPGYGRVRFRSQRMTGGRSLKYRKTRSALGTAAGKRQAGV